MLKKVLAFVLVICMCVQCVFLQGLEVRANAVEPTPKLFVSEIAPDNQGADYVEYFEIYNTTSQPINLTTAGIQLSYIYENDDNGSGSDAPIPLSYSANAVIPANAPAVFWIQYSNTDGKTDTDFKKYYSNLGITDTTYPIFHITGQSGLANGGSRGIRIADASGNTISRSFYPSRTSSPDKVTQFALPLTNGSAQVWKDLAAPTPGAVDPDQISAASGNADKPVISNVTNQNIAEKTNAVISASITSSTAVTNPTLFYRVDSTLPYASVSMTQQQDGTYQATIPCSSLWTDKLSYYVAATSGSQTAQTSPLNVSVAQPASTVNNACLPYLLITELTPDSTNVNGMDGYEFIEVYNNSDRPQSLSDFSLHYRYPDSGNSSDLIWEPQDRNIAIQPGKTMVFWVINSSNTSKTVADFNANYNTNLVENQNIVKISCNGMANTSYRAIALCTNTGKDIDVAYYNTNVTADANDIDTAENIGILYQSPNGKNDNQQMVSRKEYKGTPGAVSSWQVPSVPIHIADDSTAPTVQINNYTQPLNQGDTFTLNMTAQDNKQLQSLTFNYKTNDQHSFTAMNVSNFDESNDFTVTIFPDELMGKTSLTFYVQATDGTNVTTTDTYTVPIIIPDIEKGPLRTNIADGLITKGSYSIKAASSSVTPDKVQTQIDGKAYTPTGTSVGSTVYFAVDVQGTDVYFQNAVTIGKTVLKVMNDSTDQWTTYLVPIPEDQIKEGQPLKLSIYSGDKISPFPDDDPNHLNNRDDFSVRNARLLFTDGSTICDPQSSDPTVVYDFQDEDQPFSIEKDFTFSIDNSKFNAQQIDLDTTKLSDGKHTLTISDGVNAPITRSFTIDNAPPVIIPTIKDGSIQKGQIYINATVQDSVSGIASQSVTLDGKTITMPYDTWSGNLDPGTDAPCNHTIVFTATDKAGNSITKTVNFTVNPEDPETPHNTGIPSGSQITGTSAQLKVKVTDPSDDKLDVTFKQGYKYVPTDSSIKAFSNSTSEFEPPAEMTSSNETAFGSNDYSSISKDDGQYMSTQSNYLPYHRFEITVDPKIGPNDKIQLYWKGKSLNGRRVTMYAWNYTISKWQSVAYQFAGDNEFTLSGYVTKGDFVKDNKIEALVQDLAQPVADTDKAFTFAWLTDTQYYNSNPDWNHFFDSQVNYIVNQRTMDNIKYVIHTGDIVDNSKQPNQWVQANKSLSVLENAGIPFGVLAGNHDVSQLNNDYSEFYANFPESRFKKNAWYGDSYKNNRGHYDLISAGGNDFIIVYMGWDIKQSEYDWLNQVLSQNKNRKAILCFHDYLYTNGLRDAVGEGIYNNVVVKNPNVIMTLNGHYHGAARRVDTVTNADGTQHQVFQILYDDQSGPQGGEGFLRYLRFDTTNNTIHFSTYSPAINKENFFDNDDSNKDQYGYQDDFTIPVDLSSTQKEVATDVFKVNVYTDHIIAENRNVSSGTETSAQWDNLEPNANYFWYVDVADDFHGKTTSDVWGLTSGVQEINVTGNNTNGGNSSSGSSSSDNNKEAQNPHTGSDDFPWASITLIGSLVVIGTTVQIRKRWTQRPPIRKK